MANEYMPGRQQTPGNPTLPLEISDAELEHAAGGRMFAASPFSIPSLSHLPCCVKN